MGLRLVFTYKRLPTSFLTLVFRVVQSRLLDDRQRSITSSAQVFISSIRSSDSRTYTKPRDITSGPETHSPLSLSIDMTIIIMPSSARCFRSRRTMLPTSPTPKPSTRTLPAGKVLVDGLGVGDVGNIVLRDRKHLAEDGIIIIVMSIDKESGECVSGPDVISRGFVYVRESEDLMDEIKTCAEEVIDRCLSSRSLDWTTLKTRVKNEVGNRLYVKTKRNPMILPIIMEV